jgi:hypothetical protein
LPHLATACSPSRSDRNGLQIADLTRFLCADRYPLRSKTLRSRCRVTVGYRAQLFDALEPIMQSVRDLNKLDDA